MEEEAKQLVSEYFNRDSDSYATMLSFTNNEQIAQYFINAGIIDTMIKALDVYKDATESDLQTRHLYALYGLFNLSKWETTREALKHNHDLLPALEKMMNHRSQMASLMATFIVCLVAGRDEAGVGTDLIRKHPTIISGAIDLLNKVIETADGVVYDAAWDPDEIVIVILSLSVSDANKPYLQAAIPVLLKALKLKPKNEQMVSDIVQTLLYLSFEETTLKALIAKAKELEQYLAACAKAPGVESSINVLLTRLKPPEKKRSSVPRGSRLAGLFKSAVSSQTAAALAASSGASSSKDKQLRLMISYNWKHQATVKKIHGYLVSKGYKIWIDLEQMNGNIADRMAEAVENSDVVLVCISSSYKESINCRQEAEYAHECKKPMIILMMEKGYKANGWLGLMVGRKLWIDCTNADAPDTSGIVKELNAVSGAAVPIDPQPTNNASGGAHGKDLTITTSTPVSSSSSESLAKVRAMTKDDVKSWLTKKGFNHQIAFFEKENMEGKSLAGLYLFSKTGGIESTINLLTNKLGFSHVGDACSFLDELYTLHN